MNRISKRLWQKAGIMKNPLAGSFELLPVCNLSCKMCYVRKSMTEVSRLGGLLPAEQWLEFARMARNEGMLYALLTGGEPFLRQDFQEILAKMQEMGLQVSINSNGTLIDEPVARWLGQHRPVRINITLYGSGEETYQSLCGDGDAYNRVHRAVEWLKQYGVPVKFSCSVTSENVDDLEEIIGYAKSVDSPLQVATYMFPPVRRDASMVGANYRLSPEEAALARVKSDWLQNDPDWFMGQAERYQYFTEPAELSAMMDPDERGRMNCRAGRCTFWIDWQGNMANCGMYPSVSFPLKGRSFAEVWKQVVEQTEHVRFFPACTNCPNVQLCHACIAMIYNECGDINGKPDYLCRMNQAMAKYYQLCIETIGEGKNPLHILVKQ